MFFWNTSITGIRISSLDLSFLRGLIASADHHKINGDTGISGMVNRGFILTLHLFVRGALNASAVSDPASSCCFWGHYWDGHQEHRIAQSQVLTVTLILGTLV